MADKHMMEKKIDPYFYLVYEIYYLVNLLNKLYYTECKFFKEKTSVKIDWIICCSLDFHRLEISKFLERIKEEQSFLYEYTDEPENEPLTWRAYKSLNQLEKKFLKLQSKFCSVIDNYCNGQKAMPGYNDLVTKYPEIVTSWFRSNPQNPRFVNPDSNEVVGWVCGRCNKVFQASVKERVKGFDCPYCREGKDYG